MDGFKGTSLWHFHNQIKLDQLVHVTFTIVTWDLLTRNMSRFIHSSFYGKFTISAKFCSHVYFTSSGVCPKQSHYLKCLITKINKQLSSISSYICLFTKDNFNSVTFFVFVTPQKKQLSKNFMWNWIWNEFKIWRSIFSRVE